MEEDKNNIDKLFRSGLEPVKIEPPEKMWSSINTRLDQKIALRKKRRAFFLLLILLLISGSSYIYRSFFSSANLTEVVPSSEKASSINKVEKRNSEKNKDENNHLHNNVISGGDAKASTQVSPPSETKETQPIISGNEEEKSSSRKNSKQGLSLFVPVLHDKTTLRQNKNLIKANEISSKNDVPNFNSTGDKNAKAQGDDHSQPVINNESNASNDNEETGKLKPDNRDEIKSDEDNSLKSGNKNNSVVPSVNNITTPQNQNSAAVLNDSINQNRALSEITEPIQNKKADSVSWFKMLASHFSADLFFSPDYSTRYLKANSGYIGSVSEDRNDYDDSEKGNLSWSAGLNMRYSKGRFSISSGGSYSTFSQRASFDNVFVQSDSVYEHEHDHDGHGHGHDQGHGHGHGPNGPGNDDTLHYIIHTSCGTIDINNSFHDMNHNDGDTISINTSASEKIEFINIPVIARFQLAQGRIGCYVEAGISANFITRSKVTISVGNNSSETSTIDGLQKMNYSLLLGAGIQYSFYKRLNIFMEPHLRYSITPVNQYNSIKTYPYFIGLQTGFSFQF